MNTAWWSFYYRASWSVNKIQAMGHIYWGQIRGKWWGVGYVTLSPCLPLSQACHCNSYRDALPWLGQGQSGSRALTKQASHYISRSETCLTLKHICLNLTHIWFKMTLIQMYVTVCHSHTHSYSASMGSMFFYYGPFRFQHLAQGHFGMQMGRLGSNSQRSFWLPYTPTQPALSVLNISTPVIVPQLTSSS